MFDILTAPAHYQDLQCAGNLIIFNKKNLSRFREYTIKTFIRPVATSSFHMNSDLNKNQDENGLQCLKVACWWTYIVELMRGSLREACVAAGVLKGRAHVKFDVCSESETNKLKLSRLYLAESAAYGPDEDPDVW